MIRLQHGSEGISRLVMDRPEKRNAFTVEMYREFGRLLDQLDADPTVRCVVVAGAGDAFCAGSDIGGFESDRNGRETAREYARFTIEMTDKLKNLRHPTLASIRGACVGGGLEIACMCDIRIAARSAKFGIPVNRIGLTVDHDELADLVAVVGHTVALEILLEGRIFQAEEAAAKGLVSRVVDDAELDSESQKAATRICAGAPLVNRLHKKFVRRLRNPAPLTPEEREEAYGCFDSQDYRIGQEAFLKKQRPAFVGR
jgi:enoyl-CoA hydratase/carnithine racemase